MALLLNSITTWLRPKLEEAHGKEEELELVSRQLLLMVCIEHSWLVHTECFHITLEDYKHCPKMTPQEWAYICDTASEYVEGT